MPTRRKVLATLAAGGAASTAGCTGYIPWLGDDSEPQPEPSEPDPHMSDERRRKLEEKRQEFLESEEGKELKDEEEAHQEAEGVHHATTFDAEPLDCTDMNVGRLMYDEGLISVEGRLRVPDACYTAVTNADYDPDLRAFDIIVTAEDDPDRTGCQQCVTSVEYVATFEPGIEVETINLYHVTGEDIVYVDSLAP